MKLVKSQDARRQAENKLGRAVEQIEQLKLRRPTPGDGAGDPALRAQFQTVSNDLKTTHQALVEARDRMEELEGRLQREQENRRNVERELAGTRQRLEEASKLLKEIEAAYLEGQRRTHEG